MNVQRHVLRAPFERHLDMPGDCFCSKTARLPALHNGLDDIRRQKGQADHATYIAHAEPIAGSDLSKRARLSGADLIESAMCPGDRFQQRQVDGRCRTIVIAYDLVATQRQAVSAAWETVV
jgi:hypothetical protein